MFHGRDSVRTSFYVFLLIVVSMAGCRTSDNTQSPADDGAGATGGDWTMTIPIFMYDEFERPVPAVGPFSVTVTAQDRTLHAALSAADSIASFSNLPYQMYVITVSRDGYLTAGGATQYVSSNKNFYIPIQLYPVPSTSTRIDSIINVVNTALPEVHFKLFTAQTVPARGVRSLVIFAGLTPYVGSQYGTYVFAFDNVAEAPGTSAVETEGLYRQMHEAGIQTGSLVYVTARIKTGASLTLLDAATGLMIFSNLENNTTAVTSFIMP